VSGILGADTLARNAGLIALAARCGFTAGTKRENGRLLYLVKDLQAPTCAFRWRAAMIGVVEGTPWPR
jgi:hypothetical protein